MPSNLLVWEMVSTMAWEGLSPIEALKDVGKVSGFSLPGLLVAIACDVNIKAALSLCKDPQGGPAQQAY
jgi:hypothetical protein